MNLFIELNFYVMVYQQFGFSHQKAILLVYQKCGAFI